MQVEYLVNYIGKERVNGLPSPIYYQRYILYEEVLRKPPKIKLETQKSNNRKEQIKK